MIVNDFYDVHILIHDVDLFDSGCANKIKCSIYEAVVDSVPVCKITFNSSPDFIDNYPIVDGTKITIQIKSEIFEINDQYVFRVMKFSALPFGNMFSFYIEGVIDFYELFRAPNKYSANNNSSEIFINLFVLSSPNGTIVQIKNLSKSNSSKVGLARPLYMHLCFMKLIFDSSTNVPSHLDGVTISTLCNDFNSSIFSF